MRWVEILESCKWELKGNFVILCETAWHAIVCGDAEDTTKWLNWTDEELVV